MNAVPAESRGEAPGRGRLLGRRILVVGAGQSDHGVTDPPIGNGRAVAVLCGRESARVAAADRDADSSAETARRIADSDGEATALVADVSDPASVDAMVAEAATALGGLDGIVYNVGIAAGLGLADATPETWDAVLAVNLRGAMLTARAALPTLDDGASIVFVSSVAGVKPGSRIPAYDRRRPRSAA